MLEAELATICPGEESLPQAYCGNQQQQDLHKLRLLLERECAAQVRQCVLLLCSHLITHMLETSLSQKDVGLAHGLLFWRTAVQALTAVTDSKD